MKEFQQERERLNQVLKEATTSAKQKYKFYADKKRREEFQVGEQNFIYTDSSEKTPEAPSQKLWSLQD